MSQHVPSLSLIELYALVVNVISHNIKAVYLYARLTLNLYPLMAIFLYAALSGIVAHLIIRRREINVLHFLSLLVLIYASTFLLSCRSGGILVAAINSLFIVTSFIAALTTSVVAYRLSPWHPLAEYPGPPLAKVSKWWMAYWIGKGNRHLVLQKLHEKYGPWLRVGPNELSVNLPSAVRPIYSQMFRAPSYQGAPQDADSLITTTNRAEHDSRLIPWNKAFNPESLQNFRLIALTRTEQLLDILHRESRHSKSIDLSHWISLWAMDIMGDMSFSGGFEMMAAGYDVGGWMEFLQTGVRVVVILAQVPWMRNIIALLPKSEPTIAFQKFADKKVKDTKAKSDGLKHDILGIIQDATDGPNLSTEQAASDATFMVAAGSDTVSTGCTALLKYIIGDYKVQNTLRAEIKQAFDGRDIRDAVILSRLPYLDACVHEALRLIPPVASGPPRYSDKGHQVLNKYIPPGTTVACPTYTLHRDPSNFFDPTKFIPERWLAQSKDKLLHPHDIEAWVPFAYGPGMCIGKPVALYNMKLLVSKLLLSFELQFIDGFDLQRFDSSWKEHNLWLHDPMTVKLRGL